MRITWYSFQSSPSEDRNFRSDVDSPETEEASFSGQEDNDHDEILDWAKVFIFFFLWLFFKLCCWPLGIFHTKNNLKICRPATMDHCRLYASIIVYVSPLEVRLSNSTHWTTCILWNSIDQMKHFYVLRVQKLIWCHAAQVLNWQR